jgi:hypothetical protein
MAALPAAPQRTGSVEVAGTAVPIRSLSRAEALELRALASEADADRLGEVLLISLATGVSEDEAAAWWDASDAGDVQVLVQAIAALSRLGGPDGRAPNS